MKFLPIALISLCVALSGCMSVKLPPNSCESGTFSLTVGPFFSQHATIVGAEKQADGTVKIQDWNGTTSYLGVVTTTQQFHGLIVQPSVTTPAPSGTTPAK